MIVVVTSPTTPEVPEVPEVPTPTAADRQWIHFRWTGSDGQVWDLGTGDSPVPDAGRVKLARGASGFGLPKPSHWMRESPTIDGAGWAGMHVGPREVFMPVNIRGASSDGQLDLEAAFFAGVDAAEEGVLRATTHRGAWREIALRYDDGSDVAYELDPVLIKYGAYPLRFLAAQPYWCGDEIEWPIYYPSSTPSFFTGPPFRLAPSSVLGSATVTNPGDVETFATWRIDGPFTSFSVGIGDALVSMTLTKNAGQFVEIDMHRDQLTIVDENGADLRSVADEVAFVPIPKGTSELATTLIGAASGSAVTLTFTPRYRRAW